MNLSHRIGHAASGTNQPPTTGTNSAGRPKIGCVSWCFHSFAGGSDPQPAIDTIGDLGFDGVELILLAREDITGYWTDAKIAQIREQLERNQLEVAQFVLFHPVVEGLTSINPEERQHNLDYFEAGCRMGQKLGARIVNLVAPWPKELTGPRAYLPRYYEAPNPKPGEKFHIDIADGFNWEAVWESYVETTKACLLRAKAHDLKLSIEHHTHCMIPDAASFLRLWDAIGDAALGYNMDVGWTLSQREYPPVAIHKVKHHLMNLHIRDIDGLMREFVHIGDGVMDFFAIIEALHAIGYQGYLSIEQDKHPGDMRATCQRYLKLMKEHITKVYG